MAAPPGAQVWVTTPDGALRLSDLGSAEFRPGGSQNLTISVDPSRGVPDDGRLRRLDHRLLGPRALRARPQDPQRHDEAPVQPAEGNGLSFLRQPMGASDFVAGDFYTYDDLPPGRDRLRHAPLLDRARPGADPSAAAPGARAQPAAEGHRLALERAGVDEDERVADRRAADRRPAHLRRLRALLRQVRPGATGAPASPYTPSPSRTSRRTATRAAIPAWTCRWPRRRS